MAGNILFLVRRLNLALEQQTRAQISAQFGLTTTQLLVLNYLIHQDGQSVCAAQLHQQLGTSKAALSTALKSLRKEGYLKISPCPGDDRKKEITPTPRALALCGKIEEGTEKLEHQADCGLTPEQLDTAERCLWKMLQNLSHPQPGGNPSDRRNTIC